MPPSREGQNGSSCGVTSEVVGRSSVGRLLLLDVGAVGEEWIGAGDAGEEKRLPMPKEQLLMIAEEREGYIHDCF